MVFKDVLAVLTKWLPYTAQYKDVDDTHPSLSKLLQHPGLVDFVSDEDITPVLGAARMLSKDCLLPDDHMFTAFLKTSLVEDMLFLYNSNKRHAYLIIDLGRDVCGHARVVHGGLLASIVDETYGALVYSMKHEGSMDAGPAVTANLSINYRKPVPAGACLTSRSEVERTEGRKTFLKATITDVESGALYVDSSSLFITLNPKSESIVLASASLGKGSGNAHLEPDVVKWHSAPPVHNDAPPPGEANPGAAS